MFTVSRFSICTILVVSSCIFVGCKTPLETQLNAETTPRPLFSKTTDVIPFSQENQRKWGSAVVADLDQDGWDDVITTQHGTNALIYWNEQGTFTQPIELTKGDTHGLGVADFDGDGEINIVVSQGGGDGGNPRRPVYYTVHKDRSIEKLGTFDNFSASRGRSIKFLESSRDSQLDIFATGFAPKQVKTLTTNQLYTNQKGRFTSPQTLTIANDPLSFKVLTTDVNNDGVSDVFTFGGKDMTLSLGDGKGGYVDATAERLGDAVNINSVNNITPLDYDNDGDFDLFLSRSFYQFEEESYYDPTNKNLAFFAFRDKFNFDNLQIEGENLVLENIQETWATYDIRLGKQRTIVKAERTEKYTGGRLVVKPEDAQGWPDADTQLLGMHIGYLGEGKWRIGGYVKSRLSAVVRNVTSQPEELKRKPLPARMLENRNGYFVDVTEQLGIHIPQQTVGASAGDFNNDGFIDLAIAPYGNMVLPIEHIVLMNKQGQGFSQHSNAGLDSQEIGATGVGITSIDYDQDGRLDVIFGNERGRWYLAANQLQGKQLGNYLTVKVNTSPQRGAQPVDARVDISFCGNRQSQIVGSSSDGFHHSLNSRLHFGLGECNQVDDITVQWVNGDSKRLTSVAANSAVSF